MRSSGCSAMSPGHASSRVCSSPSSVLPQTSRFVPSGRAARIDSTTAEDGLARTSYLRFPPSFTRSAGIPMSLKPCGIVLGLRQRDCYAAKDPLPKSSKAHVAGIRAVGDSCIDDGDWYRPLDIREACGARTRFLPARTIVAAICGDRGAPRRQNPAGSRRHFQSQNALELPAGRCGWWSRR